MSLRAIVIGSGASGSVVAKELSASGYHVTVLEKGPDLGADGPPIWGDELAGPIRRLEYPDAETEPRLFENPADGFDMQVGEINCLPSVVGGGTYHWDAKTPRFWTIDFKKKSLLGRIADADVIDWPFEYADLEPFYIEIERAIGVQGSLEQTPKFPTLQYAPRTSDYPMPPGPHQLSSLVLAKAASSEGVSPYPIPSAINSEVYGGRPACVNCGHCCDYSCAINARGGAHVFLEEAVSLGAEVMANSHVRRIVLKGKSVYGVETNVLGKGSVVIPADLVVLAASAVESTRLALLSGLPDPSSMLGRGLMFHSCISSLGYFGDQKVNDFRGRGTTLCFDDFADPDFHGARELARERNLPYFRGGITELGHSPFGPIQEATLLAKMLASQSSLDDPKTAYWNLLQRRTLSQHTIGMMMHAEDLPQTSNRIELSHARDWLGLPVPKMIYSPHRHERVAAEFYSLRMNSILKAAGATLFESAPELRHSRTHRLGGFRPTDFHILGGMRMANRDDRAAGVVDELGQYIGVDNLWVVDGSVFPTSGAHNPTLTIMSNALRICRGNLHSKEG